MGLSHLIIRRCLGALFTLVLVSVVLFSMIEVLPGDFASRILGRMATEDALATLRSQLGMDVDPLTRYFTWLGGALRLDFGTSLISEKPVGEIVGTKVLNTLALTGVALVFFVPLAFGIAFAQAVTHGRPVDHLLSFATLVLMSIPDFLLATFILLIVLFTAPSLSLTSIVDQSSTLLEYLRALLLPAITLALVMSAFVVRYLRDGLIEVLESDYIRLSTLLGLSRWRILVFHALPNAIVPTLNATALNVAYLLGGVVIVERVFDFPGFGRLIVDSIQLLDVPLIMVTVLIAAALYVAANLIADVVATLLNPRIEKS